MKIDFVRHGQTPSNKAELANGQTMNDPLNKEGIEQANKISGRKFSIVYI